MSKTLLGATNRIIGEMLWILSDIIDAPLTLAEERWPSFEACAINDAASRACIHLMRAALRLGYVRRARSAS